MPDRIDSLQATTTPLAASQASALFLSAFFDELLAAGVREVVVSPGSRSTPLAMVVYASNMKLYVDIDERGAAFFALGLAKASGKPVCLICTSGTAIANYYPAILEAESSRVPLIVLTGDRPPHLQNLGAPQTCDQIKAYGDHVRHFQQMPLPQATSAAIAFARQMGKTACVHAIGKGVAGPVHFNFPFDEPLKPDLSVEGLFSIGHGPLAAREDAGLTAETAAAHPPTLIAGETHIPAAQACELTALLADRRVIVLAGEGSCADESEARELIAWAQQCDYPLIADPLSQLRSFADPQVIDNYDNIFEKGGCPDFDAVIRFGRYPVSKHCTSQVCRERDALDHAVTPLDFADNGVDSSDVADPPAACPITRPIQIVIDSCDTRDFNAATDVFVQCKPIEFVRSLLSVEHAAPSDAQHASALSWIARNDEERLRIEQVSEISEGFEGAYAAKLIDLAPENSLVFVANSMAIRTIDTFYLKSDKRLTVLCNRGLNGIDGTVSSALGAGQHFAQTTFLTGDLTLLHDLNALALHRELVDHHGGKAAPSIIIVALNNRGGAIFDMLPQQSEDPYFERLFLTPQQVDFEQAARAFGVEYRHADSVEDFERAYDSLLGSPGVSLIEIPVPLEGVKARYGRFC